MTSTAFATPTRSGTPSRNALLALFGVIDAAVLTAIGTFWDVTGNDAAGASRDVGEYAVTLGMIALWTAIVFGLVVRTAAARNPGHRAVVLGLLAIPAVGIAWSGLPMVLAAGSLACVLQRRDGQGSIGTAGAVALAGCLLATVGAVAFAIAG